jgi:hypothetical protein
LLILIGLLALSAGILLYLFPNIFSWFGNLPGDIHIKNENLSFHFPLMTCILISVLVSFIFWLIKK